MHRLALFLTFITWMSCQQKYQVQLAKQIAEETRMEFAPDKRVALFCIDSLVDENPLVVYGETNLAAAKKAFSTRLENAGINFIDSFSLLPSPELEGKIFGVVNVSVCNMRSEPKHSAELATQALLGSTLRVWKKQGDFYFVQSPDDYFGWLDDGGLQLMTVDELAIWTNANRAICVQDYVFAFEKPDKSSGKVSDLMAGNIMQIIENQGAFFKIKMPDGRIGFVMSNHLLPLEEWLSSRRPTAENILKSAEEMMGRPYLWGGTSGKGVDCSGFTKMSYFLNGIQLPRDASQQVHVGEIVETDTSTWKNLQPGDLLFFGRKATPEKKERINHVALYLGDGKIIHASDRVKVESLRRGDPSFVEDRVKTFVRSKRIIGQEGKNGVKLVADLPYYQSKP